MKTLNRGELAGLLSRNGHIHLINVLSPKEYESAHIPGSYNIPHSHQGFVQEVESKIARKDAEIVVYCASTDCQASRDAARKLEAAGLTNVADYEAGIKDWQEAGYPVVSGRQRI